MSKIDLDISVYSYSDNTGERKKLFQRNVSLDESFECANALAFGGTNA